MNADSLNFLQFGRRSGGQPQWTVYPRQLLIYLYDRNNARSKSMITDTVHNTSSSSSNGDDVRK